MPFYSSRTMLIALGAFALAAPLGATVRDGVEAWSRGDYAAAVAEWQGPAAAGDADAMFNLAQAYRLGRGVPLDPARAETLYASAAELGHVQAADTYGLLLFQGGRQLEALPYVQSAARRGDPRAQYLLGIAHFNGVLVERDMQRAYALLTLANAAGLPQAAAAIAQMDETIPLEERQQAAALAREMEAEAQSTREVELASADLGSGPPVPDAASPRAQRPDPASVSPSIAAARAAVEEARRATGTDSPESAGASYAERPAMRPTPAPRPAPQVAAAAPRPSPRPASAPAAAPAATTGPWRVQLGAFSVRGNAEALWSRLSARRELAGRERMMVASGRVTKLQAGGYSQAAAQSACRSLQAAGHACLVTRN